MSSNDDSLVTLASVSTEVEAQLLVNMLNENGIAAVATGGSTSQFRAEAPGVVRVLLKQADLPVAKSVLAEREQDRLLEAADEDAESSVYEPRLTRFGIWCLLVLVFISIVGNLVVWSMEGPAMGRLVAFVFDVVLVAVILSRLRLKRAAGKIHAAEP